MPIECNQFFIPTNSIHTTRNSNPSNFKVNVQHKENYFRFSFFPRTVNLWNSLSKDIKNSSSVKLLKTRLRQYFESLLPSYIPP